MMISVFDPAMCCPTGICGASIDPQLVRFAADLDWLKTQGVSIERFNLADQPAAFAGDTDVKQALESKGEAGLPLIKVDGEVKSSGLYPPRDELAAWVGLDAPTASIVTEAVTELVAIGAAIASNCETCFKFHYDKARKLGVSREDMLLAVSVAQQVKDAPAKTMTDLANRYLGQGASANSTPQDTKSSGCCGGSTNTETPTKSSGCC